MITFPYGVADFEAIRRDGMVYVDRTSYIRKVEDLGRTLVFLRPRRFGKSLWLQTLANYYDLRRADEFDELFGGLAIADNPTPKKNSYFIMQWNLSTVSAIGGVERIAESLREHVASQAKVFAREYRDILSSPVEVEGSSAAILSSLLAAVRETPYKLYLLIDEYDNFVNEVMTRDVATYRALFEDAGPYKELFKSVKNAVEGKGMERVFVTGVAPVALNDLTSGFNNAEDISLDPDLGALCGFREKELRDLLVSITEERALSVADVEEAMEVMRTWYNGYRFTLGPPGTSGKDLRSDDLVYNPTNTLYFLKHLLRWGTPPRQLHDQNLRTDRAKLAFLARMVRAPQSEGEATSWEEGDAGTSVVEELTEGTGEVKVSRLQSSFSVDDLVDEITSDRSAVSSFLYYMGLLTLAGPFRLKVPNLVVRKLFLERLLNIYLPHRRDSSQAWEMASAFFQSGSLGDLLVFFEKKLLPVLSNRDRGAAPKEPGRSGSGVNEMVIKSLFLSILFDDQHYVTFSELELSQGYADLCLLVRPEMREESFFDLLFEFKLVRRKELKMKGQELRELGDEALRKLPLVEKAFADARNQIERYRAALVERFDTALNLRCYVVVAVGLERLVGEEIT